MRLVFAIEQICVSKYASPSGPFTHGTHIRVKAQHDALHVAARRLEINACADQLLVNGQTHRVLNLLCESAGKPVEPCKSFEAVASEVFQRKWVKQISQFIVSIVVTHVLAMTHLFRNRHLRCWHRGATLLVNKWTSTMHLYAQISPYEDHSN